MSRAEEYLGNIIAILLGMIIVWSLCYSIFTLLFRDGRGLGLYGNRGSVYMYDDYEY